MTTLQDINVALNWNLRVNENFRAVSPAGLYGIKPSGTGFNFDLYGGEFNGNTVADSRTVLGASGTHYVVANRTTGAVSASTGTTNWLNTSGYLQLYQVVTGAASVTSALDKRQAYGSAGAGGGAVAGSDKQVQFNDGGALGAEAGFEYDKTTNTLTADKVYTGASATGGAGLRAPHGTAPTSPTNGDVWTTTAGMYVRINGATIGPLGTGGGAADRTTVTALSIASGVVNIDCSLGDYFTLALNANVTSITFSNLPGSGKAATLMVRITQDTTPRTVAWPASFRWEGSAPAVSTGSGAIDVLALTTFDNGTKWDSTLSKGRA